MVPLGEMSVTKVANTKSVTNNETYKVSFRDAENEEKFTFNMKKNLIEDSYGCDIDNDGKLDLSVRFDKENPNEFYYLDGNGIKIKKCKLFYDENNTNYVIDVIECYNFDNLPSTRGRNPGESFEDCWHRKMASTLGMVLSIVCSCVGPEGTAGVAIAAAIYCS